MNPYRDVLTTFELTVLVLALLAPGFARGLAKLLVIHANALQNACRSYRQSWNRNAKTRQPRVKAQQPRPTDAHPQTPVVTGPPSLAGIGRFWNVFFRRNS